jgi:hypothetical protein
MGLFEAELAAGARMSVQGRSIVLFMMQQRSCESRISAGTRIDFELMKPASHVSRLCRQIDYGLLHILP